MDLVKMYEVKKKQYGRNTYQYVSRILQEAKPIHKIDFFNSKKVKDKIADGKAVDHEQSWRAFKGKNLEKLIVHIIQDEVQALGLKIVGGNKLEQTSSENLSKELSTVKKKLLVDYKPFGSHLPDVDIVIYTPKDLKILAVVSCKVTLQERIAQSGYWKFKLKTDKALEEIKVYFITPDEDQHFKIKIPTKKSRAIVEVDLDGSYIMSENTIEESDKVKTFDKFIDDLKKLIK